MTRAQRNRFTAKLLPAVILHARIHWNDVDTDELEERAQNAAATAWKMYVSACKRKKAADVHGASLSRYAVSATDDGDWQAALRRSMAD